jgi:hypothetical protein
MRCRRPSVAGLALLAVVLVAGCGAPAYTYVKNSGDHTYVKIPASWHLIDQKDLDDAIGLDPAEDAKSNGLWLQGYDAAESPSPLHLFGSSTTEPAALVSVQQVPDSSRGGLSLDGLRDLFFPVSPSGRQNSQNPQLTGFGLVSDDVLTPGDGLRGVHSVFRYSLGGGPPQMMDQTAYLNDDASKIYVLLVRCSTTCYKDRHGEISTVVSSFTIREKP